MKLFYEINFLLCRCLEVVNVLIALPFGAFIYAVSVDCLTSTIPISPNNPSLYSSDTTINAVSFILAVIAVLYVNGSIALSLDKRRFLEYISQSVEDIDRQDMNTGNASVTIVKSSDVMPEEASEPVKTSAQKPKKKSVKKKTATKRAMTKKAAKASSKKKR